MNFNGGNMDMGNGVPGNGNGGGNGQQPNSLNTSQPGASGTGKGPSPQQVLSHLMRMDSEQRNALIAKNPQLRAFLLQVEQQRRYHLQKMQQDQQQQQQQQQLSQLQSPAAPIDQKQQHPRQYFQSDTIPQNIQQQNPPSNRVSQQFEQPQQHLAQQRQQFQNTNQRPSQKAAQQPSISSQESFGNAHDLLENIPKKPLQKKGLKKKALSDVHPPATPVLNNIPGAALATQPNVKQQVPRPTEFMSTSEPLKSSNLNKKSAFTGDANVLSSAYEWSEKLIKEGKSEEINLDLKIYENMIAKDLHYLEYAKEVGVVRKQHDLGVNDKIGLNGKIVNRITKDFKFYQEVKNARMKSTSLNPAVNQLTSNMWGDGYSGYGNGFTNGKVEFIFPENSKMEYAGINTQSERLFNESEMIPIRLEFDIDRDGFKLNDTFLWSPNDDDETLRLFVAELLKDYRIENNQINVSKKIISSIKEQISDFHPMVTNRNIDLRFPISLDITIANNHLVDKFDWDLMNQENNPEEFAKILCEEFSLPTEFETAISHSIREQCQVYLKSLYMIGYKFDGSTVINEDLKEFLRSGLDQNNVILPRYLLSDFTPSVSELSVVNYEKIIKERERELRRKKRGATRVGRRGGFILPDLHNMPKTFRTPLPNATFPGAVSITEDNNRVDGFIDTPIAVLTPLDQIKKVKEKEFEYAEKAELIQKDQVRVKHWLSRVRDRRMRGETFSGSARIIDNDDDEKDDVAREVDGETQSLEVKSEQSDMKLGKENSTEISKKMAKRTQKLEIGISFVFR